jgi:hypothetical protein
MLDGMDEYQAEDAAVDQAREEVGFDDAGFRTASRVGYGQVTELAMPKAGRRAWKQASKRLVGSAIRLGLLKTAD